MRISKKSRLAAVLGAAVMAVGLAAAPASAQQSGGAAGVIAAVIQVDRTLNDLVDFTNTGNIEIVTVKDSLNNVLNNNRVEVLSRNQTTIQNFLNNCTVLSCIEIRDFLNNNDVAISDVVAVDVLSGGDITVFVQR